MGKKHVCLQACTHDNFRIGTASDGAESDDFNAAKPQPKDFNRG